MDLFAEVQAEDLDSRQNERSRFTQLVDLLYL